MSIKQDGIQADHNLDTPNLQTDSKSPEDEAENKDLRPDTPEESKTEKKQSENEAQQHNPG